MKFNSILKLTDGQNLLHEITALRKHSSARVEGVRQTGASRYQFVAELDINIETWFTVTDDGEMRSVVDGELTAEPGPPIEVSFPQGMPEPVQMLYPEALFMWGRRGEGFYPMLVQEVGHRSLLITFEHVDDPAHRATAIVNRETGILERLAILGDVTILTDIKLDVPLTREREPEFNPITDWIRPNY